MTTLTQFIAASRNFLGDPGGVSPWFSDAKITQWIQNAINNYSIHFPRLMNVTIDASAGIAVYELADDIRSMISVEYQPLGSSDDPPVYLQRLSRFDPAFPVTPNCYDWVKRDESTGTTQPSSIFLSTPTAAAADTYEYYYTADHFVVSAGADVITVPDRHHHLLMMYIRWHSLMNMSLVVKKSDIRTLYASSMPTSEVDIRRAKEAYDKMLADAKAAEGASGSVHWGMDKHDRVY